MNLKEKMLNNNTNVQAVELILYRVMYINVKIVLDFTFVKNVIGLRKMILKLIWPVLIKIIINF